MEHVEWDEKDFIPDAKNSENTWCVVEPHDGVRGEVGDLVGGVSPLEGGVHLDPVTGDVQCYQELEQEEVGRVEVA